MEALILKLAAMSDADTNTMAQLVLGERSQNRQEEREAIEKALADDPANLDKQMGFSGNPFLVESAAVGDLSLVKMLIEKGAAKDAVSYTGVTAINMACRQGHEEVASYLLDVGADASIPTSEGWTSLLAAVAAYSLPIVRMLLSRVPVASRVNARNKKGETALARACLTGRADIVKALLVEGGADPLIPDARQRTPKQIAQSMGHADCVAVIEAWEKDMIHKPLLLHKARCVSDMGARKEKTQTTVPPYLQARRNGTSSEALPSLEVIKKESGEGEEEDEVAEVARFVVEGMSQEVYRELCKGIAVIKL